MIGLVKRIVVLGSTGSVGQRALDVVRGFRDRFQVIGLAAYANSWLLEQQVVEFQPNRVYYPPDGGAEPLGTLAGPRCSTVEEMVGLSEVDVVIAATARAPAVLPGLLAALRAEKQVVLASKDALVMAGELLVAAARGQRTAIIPVDGALSSIWQCLLGEPSDLRRVIFTATEASPAAQNPSRAAGGRREAANPSTGRASKARVDRMTLMSVGAQIIAAHHLFAVPYDRMEVVTHPEQMVQAMVEFRDGSVKAVLTQPARHRSLQYALSYPERWHDRGAPPIDLVKVGRLSFHPLEEGRYPCLESARRAGMAGGTATTVLHAANDIASAAFLQQRIELAEIPRLVGQVLEAHKTVREPALDDIYEADAWARRAVHVPGPGAPG